MRDSCYIVFDRYGVVGMKKRKPALKAGEHAVIVDLQVPDSVFARDIPVASVQVPEAAVINPTVTLGTETDEEQ